MLAKISYNIVLCNKIYTIKMYLVERKKTRVDRLQYKLLSQMRQNQILSNSHCDVISKYSFSMRLL